MAKVTEEYENNCKGPAKHDTLAEFIIESNFVDELKLVNSTEKIDFKGQKKFFSYILAFTQNLIEVYFQEQVNAIKEKLSDTTLSEKSLIEHHTKYKTKLENMKHDIERLRTEKSELEILFDKYERKKRTIEAEFESTLKLKEMEIKSKTKALEIELQDHENYIASAKEERKHLLDAEDELKEKINTIEKETLMESAELDSEIIKIDGDLEGVREALRENNPKVEQIQQFFNDTKEYINTYKEELSKKESVKALKMKLFNLQRKVNDKEFENNQKELAIKRDLNEKLKQLKLHQDESRNNLDDSTLESSLPNLDELEQEIRELEEKKERLVQRKNEKQAEIDEK